MALKKGISSKWRTLEERRKTVGEEGRILIFTGEGKGKTTAALGMALRAHGHGIPVAIVQFVKSDVKTGEFAALSRMPGVEIFVTGHGFCPTPERPPLPGTPPGRRGGASYRLGGGLIGALRPGHPRRSLLCRGPDPGRRGVRPAPPQGSGPPARPSSLTGPGRPRRGSSPPPTRSPRSAA